MRLLENRLKKRVNDGAGCSIVTQFVRGGRGEEIVEKIEKTEEQNNGRIAKNNERKKERRGRKNTRKMRDEVTGKPSTKLIQQDEQEQGKSTEEQENDTV